MARRSSPAHSTSTVCSKRRATASRWSPVARQYEFCCLVCQRGHMRGATEQERVANYAASARWRRGCSRAPAACVWRACEPWYRPPAVCINVHPIPWPTCKRAFFFTLPSWCPYSVSISSFSFCLSLAPQVTHSCGPDPVATAIRRAVPAPFRVAGAADETLPLPPPSPLRVVLPIPSCRFCRPPPSSSHGPRRRCTSGRVFTAPPRVQRN